MRQFCRACELALPHGVELHVRMSPPGHTDFGYYTVFSHCPRCKRGTGETWTKPSAHAQRRKYGSHLRALLFN